MSVPILEVENLTVILRQKKKKKVLVDNLSFKLYEGQCLGILGESGSGKSLTVKAILGLLDRNFEITGKALFKGKNLLKENKESLRKLRGEQVTMVLQNPMTCFDPLCKINDQIAETFAMHLNLSKKEIHELSIELLNKMLIKDPEEVLEKYPHQLSGGMLQRIMIGIALALKPDLLVADEPTTAIDAITQYEILEEFMHIKERKNTSMIFITHDLGAISKVADEISFRNEKQESFFGKTRKQVLFNISLNIAQGTCLGILGESGSGKSTLGRVICGMLKPDSGIYTLNDVEIYKSKSNKKILQEKLSIVFQDYTTSTNPRFKIKDIIAEGLSVYKKRTKKNIDLKKEIVHLLEMVGLDETFLNRFPHQLSGGQLQRVCIARAVACQPEVILLDEAISSLDAHTQVQVMDLLKELKEKLNLTYIFITHDLTSITYLCDEVVFLKDGKITESLKVKDLNKTTDEYAKKLIHSIIEF